MRRTALFLSAAALVFSAGVAQAQGKSFAGTWALAGDAAAAPGGRGGGFGGLGPEVTITQDAKVLTTSRTTPNGEVKSVYNLDGSESKNTTAGRGGAPMESSSKAKWEGDKLVITTTSSFNGNSFERTMALSMDSMGMLVVEATSPGRGGGAPMTTKQMYTKKS
jgi:hypothetical protein